MNITIEQLLSLAFRYRVRIVVENCYVSFIQGCKTLDLYDIVLKKITLYDVEACLRKMIGETDDDKK